MILHVVSMVSQFMHSPNQEHFDVVYKILRYFTGTPGKRILYENKGHFQVEVFIDANWVESVTYRRSTLGYCVFVRENLVTWHSTKQNVVTRSSISAEFRVVAHGICEVWWIKLILKELKTTSSLPMKVFCDNKATIATTQNPKLHNRTKHVEVIKLFIKEKLENELIIMPYIPTSKHVAIILTEGLLKKKSTKEEV